MPSKKQRAKASKQEVSHTFQKLNSHKDNTPEKRKLKNARAAFEVQKMLGRPIKKYNLLYSADDGDWFSSEDNLADDFILNILRCKSIAEPINCGNWQLMYKMLSKDMPDNQQFYMYANLSDTPFTLKGVSINKFEYFTWKELK
tara:strand:+ start:130 stop:561 length:432 start_codon:yes stop_codon:yes gene_type:complete